MDAPSKPVLRVAKMKRTGRSTPQSVDAHLSRTTKVENADPTRSPLNEWIVGGPGELPGRIDAVLAKGKIDKKALRRDATIANDLLLTVSPQWFRPDAPEASGTWRDDRLATFKQEAAAFLREQFGGRVVAAVLHLDEATPHIQAVVVPVVRSADGSHRLSGKSYFNPERLRDLQGAWEARLTPHGVSPRVQNSPARHTTLKTYYSALGAAPQPPRLAPSPPPPQRLLEASGSYQKRLADWQETEVKKAARKLKPLTAAAARGALYESERRANDALRGSLATERTAVTQLREQVAQITDRAELDKAQIARLRGIPINAVAAALGYSGEVGKRENPIDLVKRIGGLDFQGATAWLHHAFGADATVAAVADQTRTALADAPPPPVFTKAEQTKARAITKQLSALAAPSYRLTVMRNTAEGKQVGQNLGKSRQEGEPERLWTKDEIIGMLPTLTSHNMRGGNLFLTPIDPAARHVLLDDLKPNDLDALRSRGYEPTLVLETSPQNHQVVLKVDRALDEHATNEFFKSLNRELGDEHITGLVHPMRLAGFTNRKDKHQDPTTGQYPFVRVVEAANRFCARAREVVVQMAEQIRSIAPGG